MVQLYSTLTTKSRQNLYEMRFALTFFQYICFVREFRELCFFPFDTHTATNAQPLIIKRYGHCYVTVHRIIVAHSFDCWWRKIFFHPFCVTIVSSENTPSPTNNNVFGTVAHTLSYTRATNYNLIKGKTVRIKQAFAIQLADETFIFEQFTK